MSNEELKQNLTSTNQWLRLVYMVLFAVLLEIAGFVMLAVIIAQFLFAIFSGSANDNLRRLGDQISSYIYQTLQFLIYNTEEKPFPFSEWPESEEEDLSSYESAEQIDGEVIAAEEDVEAAEAEAAEAEVTATQAEAPKQTKTTAKSGKSKKAAKAESTDGDEPVIQLGADSDEQTTETVAEEAEANSSQPKSGTKSEPKSESKATRSKENTTDEK